MRSVIVCVAIIAAAFILMNNNSNDVVVVNDTEGSGDSSVNESSSSSVNGSSDNGDSSSAELGFRANPKTEADYVSGNSGDINPNYGDYYVMAVFSVMIMNILEEQEHIHS